MIAFRILITVSIIALILTLLFILLVLLQPEWLMAHLRARSPEVIYSIDTDQPVVALTIDDGPDETYSRKILDLLKKHHAHATFFIITERVPGNEEILQRMVEEGHEIGNHLTEDEPSIKLTNQQFEQELIQSDQILSQYGEVVWIRPGSGWFNDEMLETINKHGYHLALGSVYPYDPQIGLAWYSAKYVLWKAKPGAVIVLHDYENRGKRTVAALEEILPQLEDRGYQVVTLSELLMMENGAQ
ncbi:MAG: chitin deacetylase family protein [Anaerolineales bacterium]|jgi:peptidoglycan/xylan/chitin deacetylase (PgdA/CDA1 family)